MSIIIFIIVLSVLVFVHEFGHFIVAKKSGIRVDEFAIGFPPKIWGFKKGETQYSINLIPIGGYVKIYGENAEDDSVDQNAKNSFVNKSAWVQAAVLVAGVTFNVLFAWLMFFIAFMAGTPTIATDENISQIRDLNVSVVDVYENSPAAAAGLKIGDKIMSISDGAMTIPKDQITVEKIQDTIKNAQGPVTVSVDRSGNLENYNITPKENVVGDNQAIGIALEKIGTYSLPPHKAFIESIYRTGSAVKLVAVSLVSYIGSAFVGKASLDAISGPVGIVGIVGDAANFGFIYLLSFAAFISINLAVLNILPFPALDGGRLIIVLIESITRKRIKPAIVGWINTVGFALLILLMIVITINDVLKLF